MIEIKEQLSNGNVVDSEGDVRSIEDFIDLDGAVIDVPEPAVDTSLADARHRYEAASADYDNRLEKLADKMGSTFLARRSLEAEGIFPPAEPEQFHVDVAPVNFAQQLREQDLQAQLDATESMVDPEERERAKKEILARYRAKEEHRKRIASEPRYRTRGH